MLQDPRGSLGSPGNPTYGKILDQKRQAQRAESGQAYPDRRGQPKTISAELRTWRQQ